MLLRTCHRKFMGSLSGLSPGFSDMATSQVAPLWRSSHRLCTSRSSNHGASSSSKRIVQRLAVAAPADSFYAVGTSFQKLGLSSSIADAIQQAGFSEPAQIQVRSGYCDFRVVTVLFPHGSWACGSSCRVLCVSFECVIRLLAANCYFPSAAHLL